MAFDRDSIFYDNNVYSARYIEILSSFNGNYEENIKKVININSSGRQIRNFVSTEQVANLVLSVLENFPSGFAIINVGSDWCASIKDIAKMVAVSFKSIFGKKISINRLNNNPKTSNHFKYKSIFFSKTANKKKCKENMNYVITELFKKNSSHND
jgi:nucleoside-diphosphate-sugar epimerase